MEHKAGQPHVARHIPANPNQGWVFAGVIVAIAIVMAAGAFYINRTRHHSPNDVLAPTAESAPAPH